MQKESTIDLNIAVPPDHKISNQLNKLSKNLSDTFSTSFTLNNYDHLPHLSFYSGRFPEKNRSLIEKSLNLMARNLEPFEIELSGYSALSGFLYFDAVKNEKLFDLHRNIVNTLNPLREGLLTDVVRSLSGLNEKQKKAVVDYGYPLIFDSWVPHITLTHLTHIDTFKQAIDFLPNGLQLAFTIDKISIVPFAPLGVCPRVLKSFVLKK